MQTKKQTLIEVGVNVLVGMVGSWLLTLSVIKMGYGAATTATLACIACTVWSVIRNYFIRRYFNTRLNNNLNTTANSKESKSK